MLVDNGNDGPITNLVYDGSQQSSVLEFVYSPKNADGSTALLRGHTYKFKVVAVNPTGDGGTTNVALEVIAAAKPGR